MAVLLALHGYTQNGARLRQQAESVLAPLAPHIHVLYPDAPHACDPESVSRVWRAWQQPVPPPPHCTWWRASDDGRVYDGLDETLGCLRSLMEQHQPVGIFGFSQGAMLAALAAAWGQNGVLPSLAFVVLVAGGRPRAEALQPLFERSLRVPSFHIWGELDAYAEHASALVQRFEPATRRTLAWRGRHALPNEAAASGAIRDFILQHAESRMKRSPSGPPATARKS